MLDDVAVVNSLTAEQARAILIYFCGDGALSHRVRSYAKQLKIAVGTSAICVQCHSPFDPKTNTDKRACSYHDGKLQADYDANVWADHDENVHGIIDVPEMREEFPEGFLWTCCQRMGDGKGCRPGKHELDPTLATGVGHYPETDTEIEPFDDDEDEDEEESQGGEDEVDIKEEEDEENEPVGRDLKRKRV